MVSFNICVAYSLQNFISMNPHIHDLFSEEKPDQLLLCTAILFYIVVLSDKKVLSLHNCQIINNLQKD